MFFILIYPILLLFEIFNGHVVVQEGFPGDSAGKEPTCNVRDLGSIPGLGRSLEKEMATHSSVLAWRIPWTVQSMGSQIVGHN